MVFNSQQMSALIPSGFASSGFQCCGFGNGQVRVQRLGVEGFRDLEFSV